MRGGKLAMPGFRLDLLDGDGALRAERRYAYLIKALLFLLKMEFCFVILVTTGPEDVHLM